MTGFAVVTLSVGLMVLGSGGLFGQTYPNKPIRFVTGGVGGGGDFASRLMASELSPGLGQPVIVDNRAGGFVPGQVVSQAPPDGYTLLLYGSTMYLEALSRKNSPYDPIRDFSAITLVSTEPHVLVAHPSLPVRSVKELIALARAKPGELNYSSGSGCTTTCLAGELFKSMAALKIVRISYKITGMQYNDLLSGQVQMTFASAAPATPHIKSGKLRALAITSARSSALFPGLTTMAATVPGYELISITGVWAPAKTPESIINRLSHEIVHVLNQADVKEKLLVAGSEVNPYSPEQFAAWMRTDIARMSKVIKEAGISGE